LASPIGLIHRHEKGTNIVLSVRDAKYSTCPGTNPQTLFVAFQGASDLSSVAVDIADGVENIAQLDVVHAPDLSAKSQDFSEVFNGLVILSKLVMSDSLSMKALCNSDLVFSSLAQKPQCFVEPFESKGVVCIEKFNVSKTHHIFRELNVVISQHCGRYRMAFLVAFSGLIDLPKLDMDVPKIKKEIGNA